MAIKLTNEVTNKISQFYDCAFSNATPKGDVKAPENELAKKLASFKTNNTQELSAELYKELRDLVHNIADDTSNGLSDGQRETLKAILSNLCGLEKGGIPNVGKSLMSREIIQNTLTLMTEVICSGANDNPKDSTVVPEGFKGTLKSVQENPGGGQCLLFSVLQNKEKPENEDKVVEPGLNDAKKLREDLLNHVEAKGAKLLENVSTDDDYVSFLRTDQQLSVADIKSAKSYSGNSLQLPMTYVPFLADMLGRPIVVVMDLVGSSAEKGDNCVVYKTGVDGKPLQGKPLAIFYAGIADSTDKNGKTILGGGHFRAAELTDEKLKALFKAS